MFFVSNWQGFFNAPNNVLFEVRMQMRFDYMLNIFRHQSRLNSKHNREGLSDHFANKRIITLNSYNFCRCNPIVYNLERQFLWFVFSSYIDEAIPKPIIQWLKMSMKPEAPKIGPHTVDLTVSIAVSREICGNNRLRPSVSKSNWWRVDIFWAFFINVRHIH